MAVNVWKYNSAGTLQWSATTGDVGRGITVDADGNVYVVGVRNDSESVWKFDIDGAEVATYDTGGNTTDVCIDRDGNIWVTGAEVSSKAVWKLTPALGLLLSIDVDGLAYCIDAMREHVYIGTDAQGVPKYNLRKHLLTGEEVWKIFVHPLAFAQVRCIRVKNYIYCGTNTGGLFRYHRDGSYIAVVTNLAMYYGLDVVPHAAIAFDDPIWLAMSYQEVIEDTYTKHQHVPGIVLGGGVRSLPGGVYGVQMYNTLLSTRYGACDLLYSTFNVMTITTGHDNSYMLVGLARSFGATGVFFKSNICLTCTPAQLCTAGWSKAHGDADIMYGTAVDPFGNCYVTGEEDTT